MLSNLKQALLQREYETLSEELDEMILLGEDEDLFSNDELGLTEGAKYDEHDFDDIPEDDIALGDDDLDVLLDEEQQCEKTDEEVDAELTEEMEMDILEFTEFDCVDEEAYTEDAEFDYFNESEEEVEDDFDFDGDEEEEEDEDFGLEECVDYIYLTESQEEEEEVETEEEEVDYDFLSESEETEIETEEEVEEEELSESVFFEDFMEM